MSSLLSTESDTLCRFFRSETKNIVYICNKYLFYHLKCVKCLYILLYAGNYAYNVLFVINTNLRKTVYRMTKKEIALKANEKLKEMYPEAVCSLNADNPFQLLVATRLSAQCTDARVNLVTPALFEKYPDIEAFARADVQEVENIIHSCGFFRQKARDIIGAAQQIIEKFGSVVPDNIEFFDKSLHIYPSDNIPTGTCVAVLDFDKIGEELLLRSRSASFPKR